MPPRLAAALADAAAALLALADDNGLAHLRAVALDYIVHHFGAVARTGKHAWLVARCSHIWATAASALPPSPHLTHPPPHTSRAEAYQALSRRQVALVAEEACAAHARTLEHIKHMADLPALPPPSY